MTKLFDYGFKIGYKAKDAEGTTWKLASKTKNGFKNNWIKLEGSNKLEYSSDVDYVQEISSSVAFDAIKEKDIPDKPKSVLELYNIEKIITPDEVNNYIKQNDTLRILQNKIKPKLEQMGKSVYIVPSTLDRKGRYLADFPHDYLSHFYGKDEKWYDNFIYFMFYLDKNLNMYTDRQITGRFSKMTNQELEKVYDIINEYLPEKVEWDKSNLNAIMIGGNNIRKKTKIVWDKNINEHGAIMGGSDESDVILSSPKPSNKYKKNHSRKSIWNANVNVNENGAIMGGSDNSDYDNSGNIGNSGNSSNDNSDGAGGTNSSQEFDLDPYVIAFYSLSKSDVEKHGRPDHLVSHSDFNLSADIAKMIKILGKFGSKVMYSMAKDHDHILTVIVSSVETKSDKENIAKAVRNQSSITIKGKTFRIRKINVMYAQKGIVKETMKHNSDKFIKAD